jgi:hypothetical protein
VQVDEVEALAGLGDTDFWHVAVPIAVLDRWLR